MSERPDGNHWRRTAVGLVAIGVVLIALVGYLRNFAAGWSSVYPEMPLEALVIPLGSRAAESLPATPGALRGYDVILVTLDTTRPDRLGCYGNSEIATPNLDRLAREGVIFSAAVTTAPTTLPSHASILTGLYPQHHGVRANGVYRLEDSQQTLGEILSDSGYATGAFVSTFVLDARFGLSQGFDVYDSRTGAADGYSERKADKTTDLAIDWLRRQGPQPFLLWLHYFDPHAGFAAPSPYKETSANPYDGEIAFVDHELGRVLETAQASGRKTLVVVAADHGEAFGEHGELSHGLLAQEATLRIPLIMWATGGSEFGRGVHVDTRVSQVDLMPTILSLLGIESPGGLDGVSLLQAPDRHRAVLAESAYGRAVYGWARLAAVYKGSLKYVEGPSPEIYDLDRDPLERNNVVADRAADASTLRWLLRSREGPDADRLDGSSVLGASDVQRLAALGYIMSDGVAPTGGAAAGADPRVMLPVYVEMQRLVYGYNKLHRLPSWSRRILSLLGVKVIEDRAEMVLELERLASEHPDFAPVYQRLSVYYDQAQRPMDASRARQRFNELTGREAPLTDEEPGPGGPT
jgi:arylsulfatase A-like enzyme